MAMTNSNVDLYLKDGCGRCSLHATPQCKVQTWQQELVKLREIVLSSELKLKEEVKWGIPCYTLNNKNVLMLNAFKDNCIISFLKGALLQDTANILSKAGENTQAARVIRFRELQEILDKEDVIRQYIAQAIAIEQSGRKVEHKKLQDYAVVEELQMAFAEDSSFQKAFQALTPGRQKGYLLHFAGAKQSKTRKSRIEKSKKKIFDGKGCNER